MFITRKDNRIMWLTPLMKLLMKFLELVFLVFAVSTLFGFGVGGRHIPDDQAVTIAFVCLLAALCNIELPIGYPVLRCSKKRDPETGKLLGFNVPAKKFFKTKNVLIIDDICDGGGTFLGIADKLKAYKLDLHLYVTHGIFSQGFEKLKKSFKSIFTTDSFKKQPKRPFLKVYPIEKLLYSKQ